MLLGLTKFLCATETFKCSFPQDPDTSTCSLTAWCSRSSICKHFGNPGREDPLCVWSRVPTPLINSHKSPVCFWPGHDPRIKVFSGACPLQSLPKQSQAQPVNRVRLIIFFCLWSLAGAGHASLFVYFARQCLGSVIYSSQCMKFHPLLQIPLKW